MRIYADEKIVYAGIYNIHRETSYMGGGVIERGEGESGGGCFSNKEIVMRVYKVHRTL